MSNTRKRWDTYVQEATKPPFELEVTEDDVIYVQAPTGGQLIDAQRMAADGDVEAQLRIICGDAADRVVPLIKGAPGDVMGRLISDIMEHFGYATGEAPASQS
jgi:hypothetical protein